MNGPAFDKERADRILIELAETIVADDVYAEHDWTGISLVYEIGNSENEFGYVYWGEDEWQGETPDSFETLRLARELRDSMTVPGKAPWKKCLIQITAETGKLAADFDYEGDKWVPDMADPGRFARSIRP